MVRDLVMFCLYSFKFQLRLSILVSIVLMRSRVEKGCNVSLQLNPSKTETLNFLLRVRTNLRTGAFPSLIKIFSSFPKKKKVNKMKCVIHGVCLKQV